MRILVIENEVGSEDIDSQLLVQQTEQEDIILLNNGCVCCTVRKDLISTFQKIFSQNGLMSKLDWVVIETTGLADPAPLIQTIYMDKDCQEKLRLDSVITVIDGKHFSHHLNPREYQSSESATIDGSNSNIGGLYHINNILNEPVQQAIYADRILLNKTDLISPDELSIVTANIRDINTQADILFCSHGVVDVDKLLNIHAFDPLKNVSLLLNDSSKFSITLDQNGKIPLKKMAFNTRSVKQVESSLQKRLSTLSLRTPKPLNLQKVNSWITSLLLRGVDIYRMKGILNIDGYDEMFVAHGIHMIFDGKKGNTWPVDGDRISRFVIIGKSLDQEKLRQDFMNCQV